jgi:hypothetical protein
VEVGRTLIITIPLFRRIAVIDSTGIFSLLDLDGSMGDGRIERMDVWTVEWAGDNPHLLAIMEKTRMYILRGTEPEEPIMQSAYIASFQVVLLSCFTYFFFSSKSSV